MNLHVSLSHFDRYISARAGLLSPTELNGVSKLLGTFALPALLLQNLATTDLSTIQWPFVGGMAAAKLLVFVLVVGSTLVSERRKRGGRKGRGLVEAGLRGRTMGACVYRAMSWPRRRGDEKENPEERQGCPCNSRPFNLCLGALPSLPGRHHGHAKQRLRFWSAYLRRSLS